MARIDSPPAGLTPEAPLPADCAERFAPRRLLGEGGYGRVYEAVQRDLGRLVAVKVLLADQLDDTAQVARFREEGRITAAIRHPHVVGVLDAGAETGVPWIAYELVEGQSLRDLLEVRGAFAVTDALAAVVQVCAALTAAHAAGVIHRDVKPENVMACGTGTYKVMDFGIASWSQREGVRTQTGVVLGTPAYLAPEVVLGEPPSAASDVYAVGVMLYELLTGVRPYRHASPVALLRMHLERPVPLASSARPGLPAWLDRVVECALAKRPDARWRSAAELAQALAQEGAAVPAPRAGSSHVARAVRVDRREAAFEPRPRGRRALLAATAIGVALGAAAFFRPAPAPAPGPIATPSASAVPVSGPPLPSAAAGESLRALAHETVVLAGAIHKTLGPWREWRKAHRFIDVGKLEDTQWKVLYRRSGDHDQGEMPGYNEPLARLSERYLDACTRTSGTFSIVYDDLLGRLGSLLMELGVVVGGTSYNVVQPALLKVVATGRERWPAIVVDGVMCAFRDERRPLRDAIRNQLRHLNSDLCRRWMTDARPPVFTESAFAAEPTVFWGPHEAPNGDEFSVEDGRQSQAGAWRSANHGTLRTLLAQREARSFASQYRELVALYATQRAVFEAHRVPGAADFDTVLREFEATLPP